MVNTNPVPGPGKYPTEDQKWFPRSKSVKQKTPEKPRFISQAERFRKDEKKMIQPPKLYPKKLTKSQPKFTFGYKFGPIENGPDAHMK